MAYPNSSMPIPIDIAVLAQWKIIYLAFHPKFKKKEPKTLHIEKPVHNFYIGETCYLLHWDKDLDIWWTYVPKRNLLVIADKVG